MRLICTLSTENPDMNPLEFSTFLSKEGIENVCEEITSEVGNFRHFRIWVYDEDRVDLAQKFCEEYQKNPKDPRFKLGKMPFSRHEGTTHLQGEAEGLPETILRTRNEEEEGDEGGVRARRKGTLFSPSPYGPITIAMLFIVVIIFVWGQIGRKTVNPPKIAGVEQGPILSPIERKLLFDYPKYFEIRDRLYTIYTPEDIKEKTPPPPEAIQLVQELQKTPVWMGIYDRIVSHFKNPNFKVAYHGPMFEKIQQGQVWRFFTPALLHFDLLHIFFNVLWFILLGNQIEYRIGSFRYLILIIVSAVASNTAQYLMSGPFFMGLSGIVVAMAGFIFARQQVAPWEGYLLHRFTFIFLAIFVIGMFFLQLAFFFMQLFGKFELTIGIANTAHLVGGLVGYILGRFKFFSLHRHKT